MSRTRILIACVFVVTLALIAIERRTSATAQLLEDNAIISNTESSLNSTIPATYPHAAPGTIVMPAQTVHAITELTPTVYLPLVMSSQLPLAEIIVTNATDVINGDVSSPTALLNNPGPDGISLREAIAAANNAGEPQAITFASALSRETITLTFPLALTRDGTVLAGLTTSAGEPDLTVDGRQARQLNGVLYVLASNVTVRGLRLVHYFDGISVLVGKNVGLGQWQPRQQVHNVLIENNLFEDVGSVPAQGAAVRVYMEPEAKSADASLDNIRVIRNAFLRYSEGVGVNVAANGSNCRIRNVVIADNMFVEMRLAIAVETAQGSSNQIHGTQILRNTFVAAYPQPTLFIAHLVDPTPPRGTSNSGGVIEGTVVDGNSFSGSASVLILGGQNGASGCTVSNTDFVNNVMAMGDITIMGGKWDATGNRIEGLRCANNTLMASVNVVPNAEGGSENSITGLSFRNTIFAPEGRVTGIPPESVSYCLNGSSEFTGTGNISGDPKFVDRAGGDFHLLADSPAINAGTADGAPATDIECRSRVGSPDIGAYEFGSPTVARLFLSVARGSGTVSHSPAGLACGSAKSFLTGSVVNLTASPSPSWSFAGWSGDADCLDGTVTMSADRYCLAAFARTGTVSPPVQLAASSGARHSLR